jgi:hypothetical protein
MIGQIELGLQIPSEVEEALRQEAKKQELLRAFLESGALTIAMGKVAFDGSNPRLSG